MSDVDVGTMTEEEKLARAIDMLLLIFSGIVGLFSVAGNRAIVFGTFWKILPFSFYVFFFFTKEQFEKKENISNLISNL